jgi:hypothetical protein
MHPRTTEILTCLDGEFAALRRAVDDVPQERRNERPAEGRWSVAEVLEHLVMVDKAVLKVSSRHLAAAKAAGLPPETDTSPIIGTMPVELVARRERPLVAPEPLTPKGMDAGAAWAELEATRRQLVEFVRSCDGLAIGQISFPHPALGNLNLYQWLLFPAGHHARHARQIREIGEQLPNRREASGSALTS